MAWARRGIEWGRVPWTLWVFAVLLLGETVAIAVKAGHGPVRPVVFFVLATLALIYFLLRGVRWVWLGTLAIYFFGCVVSLISWSFGPWWSWPQTAIAVVVLLLPVTRDYFAGRPGAGRVMTGS